jgi:phosphate:Na+ symporter
MLRGSHGLFERFDETVAQGHRSELQTVSRMSLDVRAYLSRVRSNDPEENTGQRAFDLAGIAVNLEAGADVIGRKMIQLAELKYRDDLHFSSQGWAELEVVPEI